MSVENAIRRAQIYGYLTQAFLYPAENWTETHPEVKMILRDLDIHEATPPRFALRLEALQAAHRSTFGVAGSLCYETEYGLPHEYRMSHELADIAGFYRAFGFRTGGEVHERPDHIAVELEFMHVLALKEALAIQDSQHRHVEICREAQGQFLVDHLGNWIHLLARSLEHQGVAPYPQIAALAVEVVRRDATRLGVRLEPLSIQEVQPTPFDPDISCSGCACIETPAPPMGETP